MTAPSPASLLAELAPLPLLDEDPAQPDPVSWREDPSDEDLDAIEAEEQKLTLRDCVRSIEDIVEALDDDQLAPEVREALSKALIEAIAGTREKVDRCASVFAMYDGIESAIEIEISRLNDRLAWARRQRDRLTQYVLATMEASKLTKLDGWTSCLQARKNPPKVAIAEGACIPDEYLVTPPAPAPRPDRDAIKRAIRAGFTIHGCSIVQQTRLVRS